MRYLRAEIVIADDWKELCETLQHMAEGYATTDPINAWLYRQEAEEFCSTKTPVDEDSLVLLEVAAETVKLRWGKRIRDSGEIRCRGRIDEDESNDAGL